MTAASASGTATPTTGVARSSLLTHVAKVLGVSQPRATHLMSLTLLAPAIQAAILSGTAAPGDKTLRRLARIAEWQEQEQVLAG